MREVKCGELAAAAVELKLFQTDGAQIAFAVMLASMVQNAKAFDLEVLACRCGVSQAAADKIIFDAYRGASLIGEAHRVLLQITQLGIESEVAELIARRASEQSKPKAEAATS